MGFRDILRVVGLYVGILAGFLAVVFIVYRFFMWLVSLFTDSVSYNIYENRPSRRDRSSR